jgi:hypothetical protein
MHYKCTTPRHNKVKLIHVNYLQYVLKLCAYNALVVILALLIEGNIYIYIKDRLEDYKMIVHMSM